MRLRAAIVAIVGVALLLVGIAGAAPKPPVVLGVSWEFTGKLAWLDARTLRPTGRSIDIGRPPTGVTARSPDGRTIALASGTKPALRFVDLRALQTTGRLAVRGTGSLRQSIWPRPERMVTVRSGLDAEVLVLDPGTRQVVERLPLEGQPLNVVPAGKRLVVLLAPKGEIGQAHLAVVEMNGFIRRLPLPGIAAGFTPAQSEREIGRQASPGVAVDPRGVRAAIVTPETLLDVDLDALAVTKLHHLAPRTPAAASKTLEGWSRGALWLGEDTVGVSGSTISTQGDRVVFATIGVELIDVTSGARRMLDVTATDATRTGNVLLTYGGSALRGFDLVGKPRFELLRGRDTGYVQTAGRWVYVGRDNSTVFTVVDARAGKVVGTARTSVPTIVLGNS